MSSALSVFLGYGVELEYMIVDRIPAHCGQGLRHRLSGTDASEYRCGQLAWSNELVLHLLELKNVEPNRNIDTLLAAFRAKFSGSTLCSNPLGAKLMPTAMHPWMNPSELSDAGPLVRRE